MRKTKSKNPVALHLILCLAVTLISGCGLGMNSQDRLERGEKAFQSGEYRAAIIDAKNILQDEPKNLDARLLLGRASVNLGDGISAEAELRRAIELGASYSSVGGDLARALQLQQRYEDIIAEIDPDIVEDQSGRLLVLKIRGDAYLGLNQPTLARETYTRILQEDELNAEALLGVVNSLIGEQNLMQARQTLDQVLGIDATFVRAWITSGSVNRQMGDSEGAASDFARAAQLANESADSGMEMIALFGLADTQLNKGRHDAAQQTIVRMSEISADDSRTLIVAARLAIAKGAWSDAQRDLQHVLSAMPENRTAQMLLGIVHKESGNLEQAEMYLSAVVAGAPDNSAARRLLAETRLALNKTEEARQALAPLVSTDDADAAALSMAASASLQLGRFDDANELLQRAILSNPDDAGLQIELAFTYFRAGNSEEARLVLQNITAASSDSTQYQRDSLIVLAHVAQGQTETGLKAAEELVSRWPDSGSAHDLLGFVQTMSQDLASARRSFNAAADLAPDNIGPLWFLAQLDELENKLVSAEQRYMTMLERNPDDTRAMVALARVAARSSRFDAARNWLGKARNADPLAVTPRKALASLQVARNEFEDAEKIAEEALSIDDRDAGLHNILGLAELSQGNYRDAEASFERAMELDPGRIAYRQNLSRAQLKRGNSRSAIETLEESSEDTFETLSAGLMLAALKVEVGAIREAIGIAWRLQEIHPDAAAPHVLEAEIMAQQGNLEGATAAYDQALRLESLPRYAVRAYQLRRLAKMPNQVDPIVEYLRKRPLDTDMRIYLAQEYQSQNSINKAIGEYRRVLTNTPDNVIAANNLAWAYFNIGDPRAEDAARHAFELQPENGSVADTLAWILVNKGQYDDGVTLLRKAVKLGNGRPEIRYHLAAALAHSGGSLEAKNILQDILVGQEQFESKNEAEELLLTL